MNDPACYQRFMEEHVGEQVLETRLSLETLGDLSIKTLAGHTGIRFNILRSDLAQDYVINHNGKFSFKDELQSLKIFLTKHPTTTVAEIEMSFPDFPKAQLSELLYLLATHGVIELL